MRWAEGRKSASTRCHGVEWDSLEYGILGSGFVLGANAALQPLSCSRTLKKRQDWCDTSPHNAMSVYTTSLLQKERERGARYRSPGGGLIADHDLGEGNPSVSRTALWLTEKKPLLHVGQLLLAGQLLRKGCDGPSSLLHATRALPHTVLLSLPPEPICNLLLSTFSSSTIHSVHTYPIAMPAHGSVACPGPKEDGLRLGCSAGPKSLGPAGLVNPNKQCLEDTWRLA